MKGKHGTGDSGLGGGVLLLGYGSRERVGERGMEGGNKRTGEEQRRCSVLCGVARSRHRI